MSRLGKKSIICPPGVTVKWDDNILSVKGPKGEMRQKMGAAIQISQEGDNLKVAVSQPEIKKNRALWGTYARLLQSMIKGVTAGYEKKLVLEGVGYKANVSGQKVFLSLGFSHPIEFSLPQGITAQVDKNTISISGFDKQLVGEVAARIRALKKPEPYHGKGIKYVDEVIRRKAGKTVKGTTPA